MKKLFNLNIFALCLPFIVACFSVIDESFMILAIMSTMITGFIQVCIALILIYKIGATRDLSIYLFITITFFALWWLFPEFYAIWILPPALLIYLTIIVYNVNDTYENA